MALSLSTITGVTVDPGLATGYIDFTALPSVDDTITINGVAFTFKASSGSATQITIGANVTASAANAAAILNASADTSVDDATYTSSAGRLIITHDTAGVGGEALTLAASVATVSGAHLTLSAAEAAFNAITAARVSSSYEQAMAGMIVLAATVIRNTASPASNSQLARKQRTAFKRILAWMASDLAAATNATTDDRNAVADRFITRMSMRMSRAIREDTL